VVALRGHNPRTFEDGVGYGEQRTSSSGGPDVGFAYGAFDFAFLLFSFLR